MITVLGATGFIGHRLHERLGELDVERFAPSRDADLSGQHLGDVVYCIGLTADFRSKPFETVEAHVSKLTGVLRNSEFDSLLYLSSTRLYDKTQETAEESTLQVAPQNPDDLYNISKAMGESIALNCGRHVRVARVSNVYGGDFASNNFLSSIIGEAIANKKILLRTSPASAKDYINVDDVVAGLIGIATRGREQIYNLASGVNVSNGELVDRLQRLTGCAVEFAHEAPTVDFPRIDIGRMQREFNFTPSRVLDDMANLIELYERPQT